MRGEPAIRPVTELLQGYFRDILGAVRVEPDSDFFSEGGDSLAVVKLIARIRTTFSITLSVDEVMEARNPTRVTALVDGRLADPVAADEIAARAATDRFFSTARKGGSE